MSPTSRTDNEVTRWEAHNGWRVDEESVGSTFARKLERELNAALSRIAELEKDKARLDWLGSQCVTMSCENGKAWFSWEVTCDVSLDSHSPAIREVLDAAMEAKL